MTPWPELPLNRPLERIRFLFEPPGPFPAPRKAEAPPPVGQGALQGRPHFTLPLNLPPWSVQHPHPATAFLTSVPTPVRGRGPGAHCTPCRWISKPPSPCDGTLFRATDATARRRNTPREGADSKAQTSLSVDLTVQGRQTRGRDTARGRPGLRCRFPSETMKMC